jgi:predicted metalloendopeptidase
MILIGVLLHIVSKQVTIFQHQNEYESNHLANYLLESINETVEPCENFYEFTCGKWIKNTKIPDDGLFSNQLFSY